MRELLYCNSPMVTERGASGQYFWGPKSPWCLLVWCWIPRLRPQPPGLHSNDTEREGEAKLWRMKTSMTKVNQDHFVRQWKTFFIPCLKDPLTSVSMSQWDHEFNEALCQQCWPPQSTSPSHTSQAHHFKYRLENTRCLNVLQPERREASEVLNGLPFH